MQRARRLMKMDTEGLIELLRDNLRDRYKDCFSIVQELLQNADDAKAQHVHFAMLKGLDLQCPLLRGPALLVVNDGPVSCSDVDAIFRVAAGNKRGEKDKIGKFGLGMKSVFHVCEGFFMFGRGLECEDEMPAFCTPWSEEYHEQWWDSWEKESLRAFQEIGNILDPVVHDWPRWFCVWIPMRDVSQLGSCAPILKVTPNADTYTTLTGLASGERASRMLPLLKNIKELSLCGFDGVTRKYKLQSPYRLLLATCEMSGEVVAEGDGATGFEYNGQAVLHTGEKEFTELQSLGCWPESTHKEFNREATKIVDKTKPHVAVCIIREKSTLPRLTIVPCVFLPLSGATGNQYSVNISGECSVSVCLHGSMFVDAGRQSVVIGERLNALPGDETRLAQEWNRRLLEDALFPLVIPQLLQFLRSVDEKTAETIMSAFPTIPYISKYVHAISRDQSLAYVLTVGGYEWQSLDSSYRLFALEIPDSPIVRKVLLASLRSDERIIHSSAGRLAGDRIVNNDLTKELSVRIFETIVDMPDDETDNERLLLFARKCAKGLRFAELPEKLRTAKIWKVGETRCSYEDIASRAGGLQFYNDASPGIKKKLIDAVDWSVESVPKELGDALGITIRKLDCDYIIDVLHQKPNLRSVEARCALLCELNKGMVCDDKRRRSAVRYLMHGSKELFDNDAVLYSSDSSLDADFSSVVLKALSSALYGHSYSMPPEILSILSSSDQEAYGVHRLTSDSVANVLASTQGISYSGFSDDAWKTLLKASDKLFSDHPTRQSLKKIPIFPYDNGERGALLVGCYIEKGVRVPTIFREKVHVIQTQDDKDLQNRLEKLVDVWSYADSIQFCRNASLSSEQLSEILCDVLNRTVNIPKESHAYVENSKWIPIAGGGYCSPNQIINISGFVPPEGVTAMLPTCRCPDKFLALLRKHELLRSEEECVRGLIEDFSKASRYCIGTLGLPDEEVLSCDALFSVFRNRDVLPVVAVLERMGSARRYADSCLDIIRKPIDESLLTKVIAEITEHIRDAREESEKDRLWLYLRAYLEEAAEYDDNSFQAILNGCDFLNVKLKLCKPSAICTGGESVPSECIINDHYRGAEKFFGRLCDNVSCLQGYSALERSSYEEYFKCWDRDFDARVGGFIIATTDSAEDVALVHRRYWADARSISDNRNKLFGDYDRILRGQITSLYAKKGKTIVVQTINGNKFQTPMKGLEEVEDLFVAEGRPLRFEPSLQNRYALGYKCSKRMELLLRSVSEDDVKNLPPRKLDELLRNTLFKIASTLIGQQFGCDIDNFWDSLASAEQLSVAVTRSVMFSKAQYYLGMIGCEDDKLELYFDKLQDIETVIEDARRSKGCGLAGAQQQKDALVREMGEFIEEDGEVQRKILQSLRREMRNRYEYNEQSMLYELFQNADDASEQLYATTKSEEAKCGRFDVQYDGERLVIAHWGRVINGKGSVANSSDFSHDLENMLTLMQSRKKISKIPVTGKFGLGFKTVFFVCDEPVVYSGRLRFKIVGGFLPQLLTEEDEGMYAPLVGRFLDQKPGCTPTVIILPIVPGKREEIAKCISKFAEDAQMIRLLAKRICRIRISAPSRSVDISDGEGEKFVVDLGGGKLFSATANGMPAALADDVPTYWATVPTRLCLGLGFALNGDLDLTTGRAKINDSSATNPRLAEKWAKRLLAALAGLDGKFRSSEDGGYAFFSALWNLFTVRRDIRRWQNPETTILRNLVWGKNCGGYRLFLESTYSIPSGLSGRYHVLCSPSSITHVVEPNVYRHGLECLLDDSILTPGKAVSREVYEGPRKCFLGDLKEPSRYALVDLIKDLKTNRPVLDWKWCSGESGRRLLEGLKNSDLDEDSKQCLREFRFMTNGTKTVVAEGVVGRHGDDAKRRGFVPVDFQLSDKYDETGQALFGLIRGSRRMRPDELARFAADASSVEAQSAVLQYVLESDDREFEQVVVGCSVGWFKGVASNPYFANLDGHEKSILVGKLKLDLGIVQPVEQPAMPIPPQATVSIREIDWQDVARWWDANSVRVLENYNCLIYDRPNVNDLPTQVTSLESRSEWLELFVLSAAFSLGVRDCQHKGFIRMLKNTRMGRSTLWDVYCNEESTPQDWMNTLEHFIKQEEFKRQYRYWMGLFMRIYQFASRLADYVQFLQTFNELTAVRSLESIMSIHTNPLLRGSGIDLPGLDRALCVRGMAFLVRELVRRNVITNQKLWPHCYVPNQTLFSGQSSMSIFNTITYKLKNADPTFGKAFDIAIAAYLKEVRKSDVWYVF